MTVYAVVFWKDSEGNRLKKEWQISILVVFTFEVLFSGGRLLDIMYGSDGDLPAWFMYRWNVTKAVFRGEYSDDLLDIPCMVSVQDFHVLWLRRAFSASLSVAYVLLFLLFVGTLWWMLQNKRLSGFYRMLIINILTTNIIGLIAESNLIWGSDIGIIISRNIYQMIPVICLIAGNVTKRGDEDSG